SRTIAGRRPTPTHDRFGRVRCLELVSKCSLEAAGDDEGAGELDEGEVELGSSFPAGADSAVVVEPGVGAFDWPAFACLGVAGASLAGSAAADDPRVDPALGERVAEVFGVVAA